jgi:hypothetical protein
MVLQHGGFLQFVEPDSLVLGEKHPALFADKREPDRVLRAGRKVLAVTFVLDALLGERVENGLAVVKIFVEIQNEVFRQR